MGSQRVRHNWVSKPPPPPWPQRESGQTGEEFSGLFVKPVTRAIQMKEQNIHWGGRGLELYTLIFIPAPPSWGEGGFLSLFSFDRKYHSISAWWELLIFKANFTVIRPWWAKDYIQMPEIPSFSYLSLSASRHLSPQNVWFHVSPEVPSFLCMPKDSHCW